MLTASQAFTATVGNVTVSTSTDVRAVGSLLDAHSFRNGDTPGSLAHQIRWVGDRPITSFDFIGGAHNPWAYRHTDNKPASPMTRADWFRRDGERMVELLIENLIAHGRTGSELTLTVACPLGLRSPGMVPKTTFGAKRVRQQLVDVATNRHKWGWRGKPEDPNAPQTTNTRPYIGPAKINGTGDQINSYAMVMRQMCDRLEAKYGPQHRPRICVRQGWEFTFSVFSWGAFGFDWAKRDRGGLITPADGIVMDNGVTVTKEMGALWRTDGAIDEFVAAFKHQGDRFRANGQTLFLCGDKNSLDVMRVGPYAGRVAFDVIMELLADYLRPGEDLIGVDMYVNGNPTPAEFAARYQPLLDLVKHWADKLDLEIGFGELGTGSGRSDVSSSDSVHDFARPYELLADAIIGLGPRVSAASWFVPRNKPHHTIHRRDAPRRREALRTRFCVRTDPSVPLYIGE